MIRLMLLLPGKYVYVVYTSMYEEIKQGEGWEVAESSRGVLYSGTARVSRDPKSRDRASRSVLRPPFLCMYMLWATTREYDLRTGERVEDSQTGEEGRVRVNEIDPAVRPLWSFQIRAKRVPLSTEKPAFMQ